MRSLLPALLLVPVLALAQDPDPPPPAKKTGAGQVYKWVDSKGVVHYTDRPPSENAEPAKLPPLQTYKGGAAPKLDSYSKPPSKPAAPVAQMTLTSPAADETFRSAERTVPMAVSVTPAMKPTERIVYLLDGSPRSEPTTEMSFTLTEVDRGEHQVSARLVSLDGATLAQTDPVRIFVKPPTTRQ